MANPKFENLPGIVSKKKILILLYFLSLLKMKEMLKSSLVFILTEEDRDGKYDFFF